MRIAMIGQKGAPALFGGVERYVEELGSRLTLNGHEVLIYCRAWYTPLAKTSHRGMTLIHTGSIHTKHLDAITHTFTSVLNAWRRKVDVYHFHGVGPSLLAWLPRLLSPRAKVVATFHCIDRKHSKWGFFSRMMLRLGEFCACYFTNRTVTVSKLLQQYCVEAYETETTYIPTGVTELEGSNVEDLKVFNLEPHKYFAFIGRLVAHKRAHDLVEAWKLANEMRPQLFADYKIAIIGDSAHTEDYVKVLKDLAKDDKRVVFTGFQHGPQLASLVKNAKAVVNPSESEGLSIASLEAMAARTPLIVADIPENLEIAEGQAKIFARRKPQELAEALIWSLEKESEARELANKAYEFVRSTHSMQGMTEAYEKVYREVCT